MNNVLPIFRFLQERIEEGQRACLVTLTEVTGASTRNPGAHMVVAEGGRSIGSFSGGCVESAVVAEALETISEGIPREVRFGAGSKYIDIKLPCGGAIDLLFCPVSDPKIANAIYAAVDARQPVTIRTDTTMGTISLGSGEQSDRVVRQGDQISIKHLPTAKIFILGHGASVESLAGLSQSYGIDIHILSPDEEIVARASAGGQDADLLKTPTKNPLFQPDSWSACVFYFHDHDWEPALMKQALESPAFYVGAMGSLKTHDTRKKLLTEIGVEQIDIERMVAPVGLIASTRDPATLALSTLADVVAQYHQRFQRT